MQALRECRRGRKEGEEGEGGKGGRGKGKRGRHRCMEAQLRSDHVREVSFPFVLVFGHDRSVC